MLIPMLKAIDRMPENRTRGLAKGPGISFSPNLLIEIYDCIKESSETNIVVMHSRCKAISTELCKFWVNPFSSMPNFFTINANARMAISVLIHAKRVLSVAKNTLGSSKYDNVFLRLWGCANCTY